MALAELGHDQGDRIQHRRDRWIAVFIGALAVVLAVCSLGGGNAAKIATLKNIEAANTWSFFQAKNLRRHVLRTQLDEFELASLADPGLPEEAKSAIRARVASYKEQDSQLTSDPKSGEGLDELFQRGKALEIERDLALRKDPYFDYGQALLQIAIVLASVAIISGGTTVLVASALMGLLGGLMTLNGFTLLVTIPFIG